jgi:hypothetical protein
MARKTTTAIADRAFCFANANVALTDKDGTAIVLNRGDVWDANDPLPQFRPDFFDDEPSIDMLKRTYLPDGFDIFGDPAAVPA